MDKLHPNISADGKRNAHYIVCEVIGHARAYAMCLHICANKRDDPNYSACMNAVRSNQCAAIRMRKEEVEKGEAIYFEERRFVFPEAAERVWTSRPQPTVVRNSPVSRPAPAVRHAKPAHAKSPSLLDHIDTTDYANVISAAALPTVKPLPGESLLDMARRVRNDSSISTKE